MTDLTHRADTSADLGVFHDPTSVAVVGASANPAKWGYWLARGALAGQPRRRVYLVNRRGGEILGAPAATALRDLAEVPELVAFRVPPAQVWRVTDEALALGVRGLLGITAEVPRAAELAARVKAAGARLVGLAQARAMIARLRCVPLLTGWRGRPAADTESLARAVVAISELVTRLPDGIAELEVNPIRVGPVGPVGPVGTGGAIAVDALLMPAEPGHRNGQAGR